MHLEQFFFLEGVGAGGAGREQSQPIISTQVKNPKTHYIIFKAALKNSTKTQANLVRNNHKDVIMSTV